MGISWSMLKIKALKFADDIGLVDDKFKASAGWISNVLKRADKVGFNCHGEGNEISDHDANVLISTWKEEVLFPKI